MKIEVRKYGEFGLLPELKRGMSLIPNILMSVRSGDERKYVYKSIGKRE
jgi:hypothetical protein